MLHPEDFFRAGFIQKTFGVNGDIICLLDQKSTTFNLKKKEPIFLLLEGNWVPFFIDAIERLSQTELKIKLEDINTPEQAARYLSLPVFLPLSLLKNPEKHPELLDIKGFTVYNHQNTEIGSIQKTHYFKQQPTIILVTSKGNEILIPLVTEYILDLDLENKTITMELPEGLLDLHET